ncbi:MAG: sugar ABC transporter ATP-binding protein [Anaerolineae bacterium]|nr:MAG: sugar ABC transporter ATP-binding protein [Anaerolineae bacterium]
MAAGVKLPLQDSTPDSEVILSLQGVSKRYGAVQAVRDVSLECRAGEIHAVVGENGSGKSTLLGIASGFVDPDRGTVTIGGQPLRTDSPAKALRLGLGMAYQDNAQVLGLAVKENLYLAAAPEKRPPVLKMKKWAIEILARFELHNVFADMPVGYLALEDRQRLEVTKALLSDPKVLLLDEPTTALGPEGVEWLHQTIQKCARQGMGIVYVSHRLPEVLSVADRVTVLRDGVSQGTYEARGMTESELIELMIGRSFDSAFPPRGILSDENTSVVLNVTGLQGEFFGPVTLKLRRGEILGIAGVEGNGQGDFFQTLTGIIPPKRGLVRVDGRHVDLTSPVGALRAGIMLLAGDRKREALFLVLGVKSNASIQVLHRLSRLGWVRRGLERRMVAQMVERLKIRTPSLEQPVQFLSGGNQQKVSLSRIHLRKHVKVILADEPTQGVDVRSRFDIYEALRSKANEGTAIIIKSSDPIELSGFCDRVMVMSRGQIINELAGDDLSERRIIEAIVGGVNLSYDMSLPMPTMSIEEQAIGNAGEDSE